MATLNSLRGKAAIVGVGETRYYKWGQSPDPEFKLVLAAVLAACADAGIEPGRIDGFSSYSDDRNTAIRLAAALNLPELRSSTMVWGGGGGGGSGAVMNAAMSVATGVAECVVVLRGLAQGQFGRFGSGTAGATVSGERGFTNPYGLITPAQQYAMRYQRWMHDHGGVGMKAQKAISMAAYHHAQNNPRAVMHGRELTSEAYDNSRWIVEPWRLFDCCQENDGAAAVIVVPADRAVDIADKPAYILSAAQGADRRFAAPVHNGESYASSDFRTVAKRLWAMAGLSPADVDTIQSYENFTGGVVISLVEHGICSGEEVDEVLTFENLIAPNGRFPLNTSGGNLAECYMHGLELVIEGVRQVRGESPNQISGAKVSLVSSGPMVAPCSDLILGSAEVL